MIKLQPQATKPLPSRRRPQQRRLASPRNQPTSELLLKLRWLTASNRPSRERLLLRLSRKEARRQRPRRQRSSKDLRCRAQARSERRTQGRMLRCLKWPARRASRRCPRQRRELRLPSRAHLQGTRCIRPSLNNNRRLPCKPQRCVVVGNLPL